MSSNLFFNMNPLDAYFINQSHNPGKLTFVNASFWEKRTAIHKPRRPFNFDLKTYPSRTILREVSRVSSLILRAKPWLAKKVLRHGNRFAARVRRRYFRRERSDDRKCVCCSQARIKVYPPWFRTIETRASFAQQIIELTTLYNVFIKTIS